MSRRGRTTFAKRKKELQRQDRKKLKDESRRARKVEKDEVRAQKSEFEADPDIAGIVPGPQPLPWEYDEFSGPGGPVGAAGSADSEEESEEESAEKSGSGESQSP